MQLGIIEILNKFRITIDKLTNIGCLCYCNFLIFIFPNINFIISQSSYNIFITFYTFS